MQLINYGLTILPKNCTRISSFVKHLFQSNTKSKINKLTQLLPIRQIKETQPTTPVFNKVLLDSAIKGNKFPAYDLSLFFKNTDQSPRRLPQIERHIHTSRRGRKPKTPDLIYVPSALRWLKAKILFKYLKKRWDPDFSEGGFIYGTTHALSKVTRIIHRDKPGQLEGLMTTFGVVKLQHDMKNKLTNFQKLVIKIKPDDIKILVPLNIKMQTRGRYRECSISLRSLALKWLEHRGTLKLVLVALEAEFVRDYTEGSVPEWTINSFDVIECTMLSQQETL